MEGKMLVIAPFKETTLALLSVQISNRLPCVITTVLMMFVDFPQFETSTVLLKATACSVSPVILFLVCEC